MEPQIPSTPSADETPPSPLRTPASVERPSVVDATQVTLGTPGQEYGMMPAPPPPVSLVRTAPAAAAQFGRRLPAVLRYLWNNERQWFWVALSFALACAPALKGAGVFWFSEDAPFWFQPFVPVLSALLIWERRDTWQSLYQFQTEQFAPDSKQRRGYLFPVIIGCILLFAGCLTTTLSLSVAALVLIVIGTIYYVYGLDMLRTLWIPLAYLLIMIPPPLSLISNLSGLLQRTTILALEVVLRPLEGRVTRIGEGLLTPSTTILVDLADSGRGIVLGVLALSLWIAIRRRISVFAALIVFAVAVIVAVALNLLRVWAFGKMGLNPPHFTVALINLVITALVLFPVSRVARSLASVGTRGGMQQMYPMQ